MIETSISAWAILIFLIVISTLTGVSIARLLPWDRKELYHLYVLSTGIALGPFLLGLVAVSSLYLLSGYSHSTHLAYTTSVLFASLVLGFVLNIIFKRPKLALTTVFPREAPSFYWICFFLALLWVLFLLLNSTFLPLLQNDALEYATVGRELYVARDLGAYPVLNPESNLTGFFGPWTHPPLYVSLIYLTYVIQGSAEYPGLMRLIAPWFFIAAALVTYAIGRGVSKLTAIFSSLFFLSTPLLFLGADSALIDSLTVCGFTLIIIFIIALKPTHPHFAVATGLVLGLSLWSHSQSILFIAITAFLFVLRRGFERKIQASILGLGLMLLIGLAIGSAPYINNYLIFKSFISDNPAVFALPSLDWSGYFEFARGIDNTIAKIQYGLFKGWFSLEAYGFVFWFWTLGLVLYIRTLASKSASEILKFGSNDYDICNRTLYVTFLCTVAYLAGVLLSILLGIDLMIKNERYMLVLVPLVSVGAAYFFSITINGFIEYGKSNGWKYDISSVLVCGLLVTLVLQIVIIGWHYRWRHVSTIDSDMSIFFPEQLEASDNHKNRFNRLLSRWSSMEAMQQLQDIDIKQGELVLSFRPADMYYTDIRMISYLDERLLPIYETSSVEAAYEELKRIGIRYVYLTDYTLPPYNHSVLMEILSNPSFSSLKFASGMFQIYELTPDVKQEGLVHDLTPGSTPWTNFWQLRLGGRKALSALSLTPDKQLDATSTSTIPFFHRDYSQVLLSGWGVNNNKHALNTYHAVNSKELLFNLMIQGRGFVTLWLIQLDSKGREIALDTTEANTALRLGDIILSEKYTKQLFSRRLLLNPDTEYVRFAIEHSGDSNIQVDKVSLIEIVRN